MVDKGQCEECAGLCCRYFALPIEAPEDKGDYDDIRWYLCHEGITVFVEDGDWYINIESKCKYLSEKGHHCEIYDKRPRVCRGYRHSTCDFVEGEYDHDLHFTSAEQMEEYIRTKFDNKKKAKKTTKKNRKKSKR